MKILENIFVEIFLWIFFNIFRTYIENIRRNEGVFVNVSTMKMVRVVAKKSFFERIVVFVLKFSDKLLILFCNYLIDQFRFIESWKKKKIASWFQNTFQNREKLTDNFLNINLHASVHMYSHTQQKIIHLIQHDGKKNIFLQLDSSIGFNKMAHFRKFQQNVKASLSCQITVIECLLMFLHIQYDLPAKKPSVGIFQIHSKKSLMLNHKFYNIIND